MPGAFQLTLFNKPSLNIIPRLKAAMRESIRACSFSREQVAEQLTDIVIMEGLKFPGNTRSISKAILDKWVSESSPHIIPLALLPAFCAIAGNYLPITVLAKALGLEVIGERERKLLCWAEAEMERRKISKKTRRLIEEIER